MKTKTIDIALLQAAQRGHEESVCALTELVREDIFAYLHRLTLDVHVAEDLCQDTIVQMLQSLPTLRLITVKSFWAWLYKTAFSQVSHQFRNQGKTRLRRRTVSDSARMDRMPGREPGGPQHLMHQELRSAVWDAMDAVKIRYRNILTLRCFQDLSYAEIALATGGSELQARLLFFRAKRSLRQQLAARGFKKKEQLLPALSLFATLTAGGSKQASAAGLVKATSLHVSAGTAALGLATTKVGVLSLTALAACVTAGVVGRNAFTADTAKPRAVVRPIQNQDTRLLDLLYGPAFRRPASVPIAKNPRGVRFDGANRARKVPAAPVADLAEVLVNKEDLDLRVVIVPAGYLFDAQWPDPIVDAPGPDILIAGWSGPPPQVAAVDAQLSGIPLPSPVELMDTWGRTVYGYDLAALPVTMSVDTVRLLGTHNEGPHGGFEVHEIRARQ